MMHLLCLCDKKNPKNRAKIIRKQNKKTKTPKNKKKQKKAKQNKTS